MCFFPQPCLKGIVALGATISIVIAFGLLAITVFANIEKKSIVDSISQGIVNSALIGLYIASIAFLLLGIAGLYGAIKGLRKNSGGAKCLLTFYSFGVFIFFIAFLGATIFFIVGPQTIFGSDCQKGTQSTLIENLFNVDSDSKKDFCLQNCPCNLNSTNINSELAKRLTDAELTNFTTDTTAFVKYQDCKSHFDSGKEQYALTMATLEQTLHCGGWCDDSSVKFFRFSNINECTDAECLDSLGACYVEFENFMKDKGILIGLGCGVAAAISLLNIITVFCICCHPGNKGKSRNFYNRMLDTD